MVKQLHNIQRQSMNHLNISRNVNIFGEHQQTQIVFSKQKVDLKAGSDCCHSARTI